MRIQWAKPRCSSAVGTCSTILFSSVLTTNVHFGWFWFFFLPPCFLFILLFSLSSVSTILRIRERHCMFVCVDIDNRVCKKDIPSLIFRICLWRRGTPYQMSNILAYKGFFFLRTHLPSIASKTILTAPPPAGRRAGNPIILKVILILWTGRWRRLREP